MQNELTVKLSKEEIQKYNKGFYAGRNKIFAEMLERNTKGVKKRIFEFAGSGGFLAKEILDNVSGIEFYHHSDGNSDMICHAQKLLNYPNCKTSIINMENDEVHWNDYNVFISISMEHLGNDIEIIKNIPEGSYVLFCLPNFGGGFGNHYFHALHMEDVIFRYGRYIDFIEWSKIDGGEGTSRLYMFYKWFLGKTGLPLYDYLVKPSRKIIFMGVKKHI